MWINLAGGGTAVCVVSSGSTHTHKRRNGASRESCDVAHQINVVIFGISRVYRARDIDRVTLFFVWIVRFARLRISMLNICIR